MTVRELRDLLANYHDEEPVVLAWGQPGVYGEPTVIELTLARISAGKYAPNANSGTPTVVLL